MQQVLPEGLQHGEGQGVPLPRVVQDNVSVKAVKYKGGYCHKKATNACRASGTGPRRRLPPPSAAAAASPDALRLPPDRQLLRWGRPPGSRGRGAAEGRSQRPPHPPQPGGGHGCRTGAAGGSLPTPRPAACRPPRGGAAACGGLGAGRPRGGALLGTGDLGERCGGGRPLPAPEAVNAARGQNKTI